MTVIESLLAETFGVPLDDRRVKAVIKAMDERRFIDRRAVVRFQIQTDQSCDAKALALKYRVTLSYIYRAWRAHLLDDVNRRARMVERRASPQGF